MRAPDLRITTHHFSLGEDNTFGSLIAEGGEVDITADSLDNRWGKIFGRKGVTLTAKTGDIRNGARVTGTNNGFAYGTNDAYISTDGELEVRAEQGSLLNEYGTLYAKGFMTLCASQLIRNKAGIIWGRTGGRFKARTFENVREDQQPVQRSYQTHHSRCSGFLGLRRKSWTDTHTYYVYTEQSDAARVEIANDEGQGHLFLDVLEAMVIASLMNISGSLTINDTTIEPSNIQDNANPYQSFLKVVSRKDDVRGTTFPASLKVRGQVLINAGAVTVTGGVLGTNIIINANRFVAENIINDRPSKVKQTLVVNLGALAHQYATESGLFRDLGATARGPRYTMAVPVSEPTELDLRSVTVFGGRLEEQQVAQILMSPLFLRWCIRRVASELCNLEALDGEKFVDKLVHQAAQNKEAIKSREDLYRQIHSMLVFELQQVGSAYAQLTPCRWLNPYLVIAPHDQDNHAKESGYIGATENVNVTARNAMLLSAQMEANNLRLHAREKLQLLRKKITVVRPVENGVMIQEVAAPSVKLIGHHSVWAIGEHDYEAEGIHASSGEGGGVYGSTEGNATTRSTVLRTDIHRTIKKKGGFFGTSETKTIDEHREQTKRSKYKSKGLLKHISGQDKTILQEGVTNSTPNSTLEFSGGTLKQRAAVSRDSLTENVQKSSLFKGSSSYLRHESVRFTPGVQEADKILYKVKTADQEGQLLKAREIDDQTQDHRLGMQKEKTRSSHSLDKSSLAWGYSWFNRTVEQDVGCPSVLLVDYWHSDMGKNLIFESILGHRVKKLICKKNFKQETAHLQRVEKIDEGSRGWNAPSLEGALQGPLKAVQNFQAADDTSDQFAAALKVGTASLSCLNKAFELYKSGPGSIHDLLRRYLSVSVNLHQGSSDTSQSVAQPNILNCEVMILDNEHTHLEGLIHTDQLYIFAKKLTGTSMESTLYHSSESQDASLTWGFGSFIPSVSFQQTNHSVAQSTHRNTHIDANQVFIRVNDLLFSGVNLKAKLIDAVVRNQLTIQSVADWFHEELDGVGFTFDGIDTLPDFRYERREKKQAKINEIANIVGTQQFYLKVGQHLIARSAEFGLQPDGTKVTHLKTIDGKTYYLRPIPALDQDNGFLSLLATEPAVKVREEATAKLSSALVDSHIRALLVPEITQAFKSGLLTDFPGAQTLYNQYISHQTTQQGDTDPSTQQGDTDPSLASLEADIHRWSSDPNIVQLFVKKVVAQPSFRLTYAPGRTGVMEALAEVYGFNVEVYTLNAQKQLEIRHHFRAQNAVKTVRLLHTPPTVSGNALSHVGSHALGHHFDVLEEHLETIDAAQILRERIEEFEHADDTVINLPLGSAIAFAGQLNHFQKIIVEVYEAQVQSGLSAEEAIDQLNDPEVKEALKAIAALQQPLPSQPQNLSSQPEKKKKSFLGQQHPLKGMPSTKQSAGQGSHRHKELGDLTVPHPLIALYSQSSDESTSFDKTILMTGIINKINRLEQLAQAKGTLDKVTARSRLSAILKAKLATYYHAIAEQCRAELNEPTWITGLRHHHAHIPACATKAIIDDPRSAAEATTYLPFIGQFVDLGIHAYDYSQGQRFTKKEIAMLALDFLRFGQAVKLGIRAYDYSQGQQFTKEEMILMAVEFIPLEMGKGLKYLKQLYGGTLKRGGQAFQKIKSFFSKPKTPVARHFEALDLKAVNDNIRLHKNSLNYMGPTHVYQITLNGVPVKIGESARGLNALGQSIRAEEQARWLRRTTGLDYKTEILATFDSKRLARAFETQMILELRKHNPKALPLNKGTR
jgi:adhesin HecA-like repeat protein